MESICTKIYCTDNHKTERIMQTMKKDFYQTITPDDFFDFIKKATSPYHVVKTCISQLKEHGFEQLDFQTPWKLIPGGRYYTVPYGTTLFAFTIPKEPSADTIFRITASHTDHPGFRIKNNAEMFEKDYLKLNVEAYGGAILNTWLDRPLSLAGKVAFKSNNLFSPEIRFVDYKTPLLSIPNLAIHMNRNINTGIELNKQIDLLPLFGIKGEEDGNGHFFLQFLADTLNVNANDILDFDLYLYNPEEPCTFGRNQEFMSSPRLDNLTSVYASLQALQHSKEQNRDISVAAFYDNEEIGSRTKQGADSLLTNMFLKKIYDGLNFTQETFTHSILKSLLLSTDVAHGFHPNHGEKNDPTNVTQLTKGLVIKWNSSQKYATDSEAVAIVQQICEAYHIPYQKFVNRSDIPGGGTLGSITSSWLPMKTVDLGIPLLAMHSARETGSFQDEIALLRLLHAFYNCKRE